eukprot:TRINITY_DN12477_c0_g1_i4.p1 TRINITY_DN12477_c0_g1~~TRINITY_DN12477_c0_g1_i4.p1  ORF type:complete len:499 (+),score=113.00 TRINITY_DN12477_c0_g1_i4:138-1634(+)
MLYRNLAVLNRYGALYLRRAFSLNTQLHPTLQDAVSERSLEVINPATQTVMAHLKTTSLTEMDDMIRAASEAQRAWYEQGAAARSDALLAWYSSIMDHQDYLAALMTCEQGKPLTESTGEVAYAASFIKWFAEEALRHYGETHPVHKPNERIWTLKQPVGVCASITPWNFPLAMLTRKAGVALAAGCSIVNKPAHQTPLSAQAISELAYQAGVPRDVMPLIVTHPDEVKDVGKKLSTDKRIRKLTFTGSTRVGKLLMEQAASNVKKLSLELGGNAPFIVLTDADIDAAVAGAMASKFRNAGQTCVCANRFLVAEEVHDVFVSKLGDEMLKLRLGNGLEEGVTQGPLIDQAAVDKVTSMIHDAIDKGANLRQGGEPSSLGGTFFQPTLLTGMTPAMKLFQDEVFGPVAGVTAFATTDEAIQLANNTDAGLASYVYGRNMAELMRVSEELEYGIVGVNTGLISTAAAPFGGVKESGLGREGSSHGLDDYTELKYVNFNLS